MNKQKKILIIIQRSNGDVFLSLSLIKALYKFYNSPLIDLLINDDTYQTANLLPHINFIHKFSYITKTNNKWTQEKNLFFKLFRKYDLSINLTSSDRSVIYSIIASKKSISVIEKDNRKSWWKKIFLSKFYFYDNNIHILVQNLTPLSFLAIEHDYVQNPINISSQILKNIRARLKKQGIKDFIIFHPSAQYQYKVLPKQLRNELLSSLSKLNVPIIITGGKDKIDMTIKQEIPLLDNVYNFIGETTLEEYFALSKLSICYVGMDTLNMHIAASQNKPIFAVFGPTKLSMWSPWSNTLQSAAFDNKPTQTYDNITLFQSSAPCNVCGSIGCGSNHGKNEFSYIIKPEDIFNKVEKWYKNVKL